MRERKSHSQIYKGFEILIQPEDDGYSVYLSGKHEDIDLEPVSNLLIIKSAPDIAKATKKALEIINETSWKLTSKYNPFNIYMAGGLSTWSYKIQGEGVIIIENDFQDKQSAIQSAFIRADLEWRKLYKK